MDLIHQGETIGSEREAFKEMCFESIRAGVLVKGARQVTKSIISKRAKVVLMSEEINDEQIVKLIEGLANMYKISILKVPSHELLGEYVRICKFDESGSVTKPARCAVAAIEEYGSSERAQKYLFESRQSSAQE